MDKIPRSMQEDNPHIPWRILNNIRNKHIHLKIILNSRNHLNSLTKQLGKKKKIQYINFKVSTNVPHSFTNWFKQRIGWYGGAFRLFVINFDRFLSSPIFLIYMLGLALILLPLKIFDIFQDWLILPMLLLLYIPITFVANWKVREKYMHFSHFTQDSNAL